ncbi:16S rRNA (cytosine(1402)-N(4))-methyltransferase RsmH [Palleronia aestuarii]|uniref:16S rRNA (cytosine(1402)-N(4))-methyltransferase RsmH n=1 Tax=Palleronia aestuarii TaxID=568105 RepID=UPI000DABC6F5|nr:16S rRNA (cytosine(1402)-N(4))-methyltransferase RsmH [Palleronia aestuarii]
MAGPPHIPVLLDPILERCAPVSGTWIDGTFGAGGYAKGLLAAGADQVIGIDRDPSVLAEAANWAAEYGTALRLVEETFSALDTQADKPVAGVVLDLGVSSMQLDRPERGFSFLRDGPLDMRMGTGDLTAARLVGEADEAVLADILYHFGEERAARRIARAIVAERSKAPLDTTAALAALVERVLPRPKPGQSHPATRAFQALRIAVNDEFGQLVAGLEAAERALAPGGHLAVVSFHSLEDRVVKRFLQQRSGAGGAANRYAPALAEEEPRFDRVSKGIAADAAERDRNPRARSARLRIARRTAAAAGPVDRAKLGLPKYELTGTN